MVPGPPLDDDMATAVRRALASLPEVVSFGDAPALAGGWGATVAELRPRDTSSVF
jgi:DNA-nicking Smr family endonuclease